MVFGDPGAVVTIETIDAGQVGIAVVADAVCPLESTAARKVDFGTPFVSFSTVNGALTATAEALPTVRGATAVKVEAPQSTRRDAGLLLGWQLLVYAEDIETSAEIQGLSQSEYTTPLESSGAIATVRDDLVLIEMLATSDEITGASVECLATEAAYANFVDTWIRTAEGGNGPCLELSPTALRDRLFLVEWAGTTSMIAATDTKAWIEWIENSPRPLSVDRLLHSPGRLRLVGRAGRVRVLKGH